MSHAALSRYAGAARRTGHPLPQRNTIDIEFAGSVHGVDAPSCTEARAHHD
jgi:hypothetical protein